MPIYDEFREAVIKDFSKNRRNKINEQVELCLVKNEDVIKDGYGLNKWQF